MQNVQAQISASEVNNICANAKYAGHLRTLITFFGRRIHRRNRYVAVAWKTGGGSVACLPWNNVGNLRRAVSLVRLGSNRELVRCAGKLPPSSEIPLVTGHTSGALGRAGPEELWAWYFGHYGCVRLTDD